MTTLEQQILHLLKCSKKPLGRRDIAKQMNLPAKKMPALQQALHSLTEDYQIFLQQGRYTTASKLQLVPAEIVKVNNTFGFARPILDPENDVFVPGRFLLGTMPSDKVLLKVSPSRSGNLSEGKVTQILEESNQPFAGTLLQDDRGFFVVLPDHFVQFPMRLAKNASHTGKTGDKVLATIQHRGNRHSEHTVEILQVYGSAQQASICAEAILAENEIVREFPEEVKEQARAITAGVGIHPKELKVRKDLREENIFTIDGADTKDIDDAISLKPMKSGWELGVHIADVSYYVTRQSPLDQEAFRRGTSVYYADQVVPMLPPELSNGICSLNPGEDRLAFSAIMTLDAQGELLDYRFEKTVICSTIKGVYSEINTLLEEENPPQELLDQYRYQLPVLREMKILAERLREKRMKRHAINLESVESKIIVEQGKAVDIIPRTQGLSENMIEEFMLTANEAAARFAQEKDLPFLYRVHEDPDPERLDRLFLLLDNLGISYQRPKENQSPAKALDDVLEKVKDTEYAGVINHTMLRTMSKAKYSSQNMGHFGLGLQNYTHFTSPIRRYSDLAIHRILSSLLTGMRPDNIEKNFRGWVEPCAVRCTAREIASMTAERSAEDSYKAEYMKQFVEHEFDGIVSSTTNFGIFVSLPNTVEGLIHVDHFPPGRWNYDDIITFRNEVGGATIKIGDPVRIRVTGTDIPAGNIDFAFAEPEKYSSPNAEKMPNKKKDATPLKVKPKVASKPKSYPPKGKKPPRRKS